MAPLNITSEQRIYIVLPEIVNAGTRKVLMPIGRSTAQAVHVGRKMDHHEGLDGEEITTITLSCRDDQELTHVQNLLEESGVKTYDFHDEDPVFYGTLDPVKTAIATAPITIDKTIGTVDYLPLFGAA